MVRPYVLTRPVEGHGSARQLRKDAKARQTDQEPDARQEEDAGGAHEGVFSCGAVSSKNLIFDTATSGAEGLA